MKSSRRTRALITAGYLTETSHLLQSGVLVFECLTSVSHLCAQMSNVSQKSKEEILQKLEDEKLCSQETKKLDQLLSKNQRLIQRTDAEVKQAKRLQVSLNCFN